jgi:hypothetical protein
MKKLIFVILVIFAMAYWSEFSAFVTGNASSFNTNITQWLVNHTPKP